VTLVELDEGEFDEKEEEISIGSKKRDIQLCFQIKYGDLEQNYGHKDSVQ
jgi:hypothetical protein